MEKCELPNKIELPKIQKNLNLATLLNLLNHILKVRKCQFIYAGDSLRAKCYTHEFRTSFTNLFGWSIPSENTLQKIVEFVGTSKVLEVAAGRGFWSALMRASGLNVTATSIACKCDKLHAKNYWDSICNCFYSKEQMQNVWTQVELMDCEKAVEVYSNADCLFISWGKGGILDRALKRFKGTKLIVVGEMDGCTDCMCQDESEFKLVTEIHIPRFAGMMDRVYFYQKY